MAWRYSRRMTLFPGFRVNLSARGVSTTIGVPGASLNFGKNGIYLNTGVPGTGFYNRTKLHFGRENGIDNSSSQNDSNPYFFVPDAIKNEVKPDISEITSVGLKDLQATIIAMLSERQELTEALDLGRRELRDVKTRVWLLGIVPYSKKLFKKATRNGENDLNDAQESVAEIERQLSECSLRLDVGFERDESALLWKDVERTFARVSSVRRTWCITDRAYIDRFRTRSYAETQVERKNLNVRADSLSFFRPRISVPHFENASGTHLYFFSAFIVIFNSESNFAILDYSELKFEYCKTTFVETEAVPSDSKVEGYTWKYVNKNGSQDRRFTNNYQIPLVAYANISILIGNRLNEVYTFSHAESAYDFANALFLFQKSIGHSEGSNSQNKRHSESEGSSRSKREERSSGTKGNSDSSNSEKFRKVLGVSDNATLAEIRAAYVELVKQYHPDKVAMLGIEIRNIAESKTKEINAAYVALCEILGGSDKSSRQPDSRKPPEESYEDLDAFRKMFDERNFAFGRELSTRMIQIRNIIADVGQGISDIFEIIDCDARSERLTLVLNQVSDFCTSQQALIQKQRDILVANLSNFQSDCKRVEFYTTYLEQLESNLQKPLSGFVEVGLAQARAFLPRIIEKKEFLQVRNTRVETLSAEVRFLVHLESITWADHDESIDFAKRENLNLIALIPGLKSQRKHTISVLTALFVEANLVEAIEPLCDLLSEQIETSNAMRARNALIRFGASTLPSVRKLLLDGKWSVRMYAVQILSLINDQSIPEIFEKRKLFEGSKKVQAAMVEGVEFLKGARAIEDCMYIPKADDRAFKIGVQSELF